MRALKSTNVVTISTLGVILACFSPSLQDEPLDTESVCCPFLCYLTWKIVSTQ